MANSDVLVQKMYEDLKGIFGSDPNKVNGIMNLSIKCMDLIENQPGMSGYDKKVIVSRVMAKLLGDIPADHEAKQEVEGFVSSILPYFIDYIISAAKGNLGDSLRKKFETCRWKCW